MALVEEGSTNVVEPPGAPAPPTSEQTSSSSSQPPPDTETNSEASSAATNTQMESWLQSVNEKLNASSTQSGSPSPSPRSAEHPLFSLQTLSEDDLRQLYSTFSKFAKDGAVDAEGFKQALTELCPELKAEPLFILLSSLERSEALQVEQVVVFLSSVLRLSFSQRIKLLFKAANGKSEDPIEKKSLAEFFFKLAPFLHTDPDSAITNHLSPTVSMKALTAALKDDSLLNANTPGAAVAAATAATPATATPAAPATPATPATALPTAVSNAPQSTPANPLAGLDFIGEVLEECFGLNDLDPDRGTLTIEDFKSWITSQKRVKELQQQEEEVRKEHQRVQLEIKVNARVQELVNSNRFTEEEVRALRGLFNSLDSDRSGMITPQKLAKHLTANTTDEQVKDFFNLVDPKHLGFITFDVFLDVMGPVWLEQAESQPAGALRDRTASLGAVLCINNPRQLAHTASGTELASQARSLLRSPPPASSLRDSAPGSPALATPLLHPPAATQPALSPRSQSGLTRHISLLPDQ